MSRFATLDSLKGKDKDKPRQGEGQEDDRDDANDYYAGGVDSRGGGSGLSVVGPPGGGNRDDVVQGIFQRANRGGPGAPPPEDNAASRRTITMYRNGFSVDDGPFRALDDPANESFLRDMARGLVPRELEQSAAAQGQAVHVNLVDKRGEDYQAPSAPAYVAYSGEGKTAGTKEVSQAAVMQGGGSDMPETDDSKPTTSLQIVLHNGKRITHKFNLTHTIRHVQAVIASHGAADAPYRLLTGFPPAELTGFDRTLEEAGLKNARITQKLV